MAEVLFQSLSDNDKRDALGVAASLSGHRPHLLEKDIWVVQTLSVLYSAPFGRHLVFKGGTSLSKAYRVIRRFSEDIDITYNIRVLVPDFTGDSEDPLPATTQPGTTLDAGDTAPLGGMDSGACSACD